MAIALPYLPSNKNLGSLFSAIESAKIPDRFNRDFLSKTIGLKGSNDRALIPLLRTLGFLDQSGTPTAQYRLLKSAETAKGAIAAAIKNAYAPLFEANESTHALPLEKLKGLIAQVGGTDSDMTARIAGTFNALAKLADFSAAGVAEAVPEEFPGGEVEGVEAEGQPAKRNRRGLPLTPEFHYNIQVHLPSNGTEEIYLNIFNALRKVFA